MLDIPAEVSSHTSELIALRRHFHEHPELSLMETETMAYIQDTLRSYGIESSHIPNAGILAVITGKGPGRTVLLRADIDALPIEESAMNLSRQRVTRSTVKGVMHACGHDGHMAMLLVAAKILAAHRDEWKGRVVLMFEQGEEQAGPVANFLRYLVNESGLTIDTAYATHVRWDVPAGKIVISEAPPMAGGIGFIFKLRGRGSHGSRPDLAENPFDCFHAFYGALQALRMRAVPPRECLTVSIGMVNGGFAPNIIPDELTFGGTARFFNYEKAGKPFYDEMLALLERECANYHCSYEIIHLPPPLYEVRNHPECVALAREGITRHLGANVLYDCEPWMASESFAITARLFPSVLSFTGIQNLAKGCGANHHTAEFDMDEEGLPAGVAACLAYTLEFLDKQSHPTVPPLDLPLEEVITRNV